MKPAIIVEVLLDADRTLGVMAFEVVQFRGNRLLPNTGLRSTTDSQSGTHTPAT